MNKATAAGKNESWELSARDVLLPLLSPSETLGIALSGATGWFAGLSFVDVVSVLLGVIGGGPVVTELNRTTYIGMTDEDLVYAITKDTKKPSQLQRAPLGNVSIVKFKESREPYLIDVLVIDTGTKKLTLSTGSSLRPVIRELNATLATRKQEADRTGSARHLQASPTPLHIRLYHFLGAAPRDIASTLHIYGSANASLRASLYSVSLFGASIAADILFIVGSIIIPTELSERFRDVLLFILFLPLLLLTILSVVAALVAAGLAIYSIFKRGQKPRTVISALLVAVALIIFYAVVAFGALMLAG